MNVDLGFVASNETNHLASYIAVANPQDFGGLTLEHEEDAHRICTRGRSSAHELMIIG